MDRLDAMAVLVAAAEAGSLSAASRKLGTPLATVSRKVADLEAHVGARLLVRSGRRLAPTDAGAAYLAACRRILGDVEEAERAAAGEYASPRGELAVAAPVVFGRLHVLPVVAAFLRDYPEIDVRLALADRMVDLVEERIDVALRIGDLPDSALKARRVGAVRRVVCASPALLAASPLATPADLEGRPCVTFQGLAAADHWTFWRNGAPIEARVRSRLVVTTAEAAVDAAIAGVGLARVLSYQAAAAVAAGRLALALEAYEPPPSPVTLVHSGEHSPPAKVLAFLDAATPALRRRMEAL